MGLARTSTGLLEVFARGTDNALWHNWQVAAAAGPWSGWESLGGSITGGPSIVMHAGGGLEVFCRWNDGTVFHIWYEAAGWSSWTSLGGKTTADPVAFVNHDGRLEVFARGQDGGLWHAFQRDFFTWSGWERIAGPTIQGTPAIGRDGATGGAHLFARGADDMLLHTMQVNPAISTSWSPLAPLTGPCTADPCAAVGHDGRCHVFFPSLNGEIRHMAQPALTQPLSMAATLGGSTSLRPVSVLNKDGRLEVFYVHHDRRIRNIWEKQPNGPWEGDDQQNLANLMGGISAARNADGRLEVVGVQDNGDIGNVWQRVPSGQWSGGAIGGQTLGGLGVKMAQIGRCALWEGHFYGN